MLALGGLVWASQVPAAQDLDYRLQPMKIAPDTYVFEGANEDFSFDNGGNIVNTGFIVTDAGVVVINTGPSRLYGEQMRLAIGTVTDQPVIRVYISKLHPDHFLGNQAFDGLPILTLAETRRGIETQGPQFTDNMYRMVGNWMLGTELTVPTGLVEPGVETVGGHEIEFIALSGHTPSDLIVLDRTTGVLFAGGVVFHQRAPTTPHANLNDWLGELDQVEQLDFELLVPSHGPVANDGFPIRQTRDYLRWLDLTLREAAESGLDMAEVLNTPLPAKIAALAVMPLEFHRSVSHLYPQVERATLPRVSDPGQ